MPDIRLRKLVKEFSGGVRAVDSLDLTMQDGEFVALLGPSGCGKTTTLRMIAGLEVPTSGEIELGDRIVSSDQDLVFVPPEKRNLGLVFQNYALWPHMTVRQNTGFGLEMQKVSKAERDERVRSILGLLRIQKEADRYPSQLSGGQQQRVALARMLTIQPQVLLLDEPLSNLDAALRLEMRAELKRLHQLLQSTVVFVTHDQLEAMTMATRIAVMKDGLLQQYGTPEEVYDRPANRFVAAFVGSPPMNLFDVGADGFGRKLLDALSEVDRRHSSAPVATAAVATIGVRPETVRLVPPTSDPVPTGVTATVATILPTGPSWIVQLEADGSELYAVSNERPRYGPGDSVSVTVARADYHCFGDDGERLGELDRTAMGVTS